MRQGARRCSVTIAEPPIENAVRGAGGTGAERDGHDESFDGDREQMRVGRVHGVELQAAAELGDQGQPTDVELPVLHEHLDLAADHLPRPQVGEEARFGRVATGELRPQVGEDDTPGRQRAHRVGHTQLVTHHRCPRGGAYRRTSSCW